MFPGARNNKATRTQVLKSDTGLRVWDMCFNAYERLIDKKLKMS